MYSLVSAPVLGFDLARLEGGTAVAEVLLRGLSLTESDLDILAGARLDDWDRIPLWQDVEEAARQRQSVREAAGEQGADLTSTLTMLEGAPIGTVDGLLHCVRHDLLDWTWQPTEAAVEQSGTASQATAVLCDAVVAAYLRDLLPTISRRRLAAGWLAAARWLPARPADLGPQTASVTGVLSRLRTLRPAERTRLARAAAASRLVAAEWAAAVHSASWAVYVSGRVRAASAAQLMLVQAIEDAGIPVANRAAGVWNLLSGTVQALVVRDVLDADAGHRLLEPYLAAMGPNGLD